MRLNYSIFYRQQIIDENKFEDLLTNQKIKVYYILHGLFGRGKNWYSVAKLISKNCEHIFLTLDLRNHGENIPANEISYDLMVSDLFELTKQLNLKTISLIGHSMGGKVSMLFALKKQALCLGTTNCVCNLIIFFCFSDHIPYMDCV